MSNEVPITRTVIPDPGEALPRVAWPTVGLLVAALALAGASTALALSEILPVPGSILLNALAAYLFFTVSHDASHHAAASDSRINRWLGRIATPFFAPQASFSMWRFIHMQHHRFTNHDDGSDPDGYTMAGPLWQRPFRWATIDFAYVAFYLRHVRRRPRAEHIEAAVQFAVLLTGLGLAFVFGDLSEVLLYVLLPQRIALVWLAFAFDYLPHHGLRLRPAEDKLKTTRNRIGGERWLSPLMLYQNYHLVHHLHPTVPFYRYLRVWRRNEEAYLDGGPALSTVRGRALTVDEYRELRALADHAH